MDLEHITTEELDDDMLIQVCADCHLASCWLALFMCDTAKTAKLERHTVRHLRKLNLEHPDYWAKEIRARYGNE